MTAKNIIDLLHNTFGGNVCFRKRQKSHHKDQWKWTVAHRKAVATYLKLEPYLQLKRLNEIKSYL